VSERPDEETTHAGRAPGTAGLGAITVIFFTIFAYATVSGVLIAADGLVRAVHGDAGTVRLVLGTLLLVPAAFLVVHLRRRRSRAIP
jgi:hypothetical protein